MRNVISPAFTPGKLKGMVETLVSGGGMLEEALSQYGNSQKEIEVKEFCDHYTMSGIASIGFGLEINSFKNPNNEFREYSLRSALPLYRNMFRSLVSISSPFLSKLLRIRLIDRDVKDFLTETVRQNLQYRQQNNIVRKDFFQLLIQLKNSGKVNDDDDWSVNKTIDEKSGFLSLDEMTAQAFGFILAGYHTSSSAMSFCLYELAKHPNIQQKVYGEITEILKKHDGKITYESLKEMKYFTSVIDGKSDKFMILKSF